MLYWCGNVVIDRRAGVGDCVCITKASDGKSRRRGRFVGCVLPKRKKREAFFFVHGIFFSHLKKRQESMRSSSGKAANSTSTRGVVEVQARVKIGAAARLN